MLIRTSPAAPAPITPAARRLALLVMPAGEMREHASAALAAHGWGLIAVAEPAAAAEVCREIRIDIVLIEVGIAGADPFDGAPPLGEHGRPLPQVVIAPRGAEAAVAHALGAGATECFLTDPQTWPLLAGRLATVLAAEALRAELRRSRERLERAQRLAHLGTWEWEPAARSLWFAGDASRIAGLGEGEQQLAESQVWPRFTDSERKRIWQLFKDAAQRRGAFGFDTTVRQPDGRACVIQIEAEIEYDELDRPARVRGVILDITRRRLAEARVRELDRSDALTGLANRRHFTERLGQAIAAARAAGTELAVVRCGLDRFKPINDTLGHPVGDQVLRTAARRLSALVQEAPAESELGADLGAGAGLVARLGSDEFAVLLASDSGHAAIEAQARALRAAVRGAYDCAGREVFVTASLGLAVYPLDGADAEALLSKADVAMVAAKRSGGDALRAYSEALATASAHRLELEAALNRAIDRNELELHYQPKIDVASGRIVGVEALMRWRHAGRLVMPGEFIPLAEASGLIVLLTEWAVRTVCRQLRAWRAAGLAVVPVAINVSGRHLQRANLTEPLRAALAENGLPASLLEIELTESVLMQNLAVGLPLLHSLKELGVRIAVDDFGTGYSSLAYLKRLPIDALKIDRSFVSELEAGADSAAIVAAIVAMARSLGLEVIGEGVETRAQMLLLHAEGCQLMQGYHFARPMPAADLARLLAAPTPRSAWLAVPALPACADRSVSASTSAPLLGAATASLCLGNPA